MEPILVTIAIMVAVAVAAAIVLMFVKQLPGETAGIVRIGVVAIVVIVLLILLWRLVVRSGAGM